MDGENATSGAPEARTMDEIPEEDRLSSSGSEYETDESDSEPVSALLLCA
jgi:hypothetical protein